MFRLVYKGTERKHNTVANPTKPRKDERMEKIMDILINYKSKLIGMEYEKFEDIVSKRKYELKLDDDAHSAIMKVIEEEKEQIEKVFIWEERISNCCNSPIIRIDFKDDTCRIYCSKCGKTCGFNKISQYS